MECPRDPRVWIACWEDAMINFLIYSVCFVFLGSKVTMDGDCNHGIKRCLLLRRKAMTNLDRIFKSRDITLPKRILIIKTMVFLAGMHRCESWTIKQTEHWRTDAFKLWCWRRLLRVSWTARRSNQYQCPTLCNPMDCRMPSSSVLHYLLEFPQIHVHWGGDVI